MNALLDLEQETFEGTDIDAIRCFNLAFGKDAHKNYEMKTIRFVINAAKSRRIMAMALLTEVRELMMESNSYSEKLDMVKAMITAFKAIHGEKLQTENTNVNINTDMEVIEKRLAEPFITEKVKRHVATPVDQNNLSLIKYIKKAERQKDNQQKIYELVSK